MENIFMYSMVLLGIFLGGFALVGKTWGSSIQEFLFAGRSLKLVTSGVAISSHWLWAIALFVGPAAAYNWGVIGMLWFIIPNACALLVTGFLVSKIRNRYPEGFSLTEYIKTNFSAKVAALYQFEFVVVAFAALLLAFTAISKLWGFAGLAAVIDPIYASLLVGLITLGFTMKGGIRTSIFTGTAQTVLWLGFFSVAGYFLATTDLPILTYGKNNLQTVFDTKFLTTFAGAYLITILVGSTAHGHLWQKAFSMPKENIIPSFAIGAVIFGIVLTGLLSLAMFAFSNTLAVAGADLSALAAIVQLMGVSAFVVFGTIFVGQTSTVIDSSMNYMASLVTLEWLKKDQVWISRAVMVVFMMLAWIVSWAKLEIWTVMMLMGAVRTVMFVPLALHIFGIDLKEKLVFIVSVITIPVAFGLAWTAKMDKLPIFDLYSASLSIIVPLVVLLIATKFSTNKND